MVQKYFVNRSRSILRISFLQAKTSSYFYRIFFDRKVLKGQSMYIEIILRHVRGTIFNVERNE